MLSLRYVLVTLAFLALAWPASAQEVDWQQFYPLDIGDTWTFEVATPAELAEPILLAGYQRRTVIRDTVLAGEAYRLVRVDSLSKEPGYPVLSEALCAVRVLEEEGRVEWLTVDVSGGGTCWAPEAAYDLDLRAGTSAEDSLYLNAVPYEFEAVETWGSLNQGAGDTYFLAAADFGLVQWTLGNLSGGAHERSVLRVVHAVVGGEEYGRPIESDAWKAFYPLNEGDVYEYKFVQSGRGPTIRTYLRWDVEADTTIEGESYQIVRKRTFDDEFRLIRDGRCAVRITAGGEVDTRFLVGAHCELLLDSWYDLRSNTWTAHRRAGTDRVGKYYVYSGSSTLVEGIGVVNRVTGSVFAGNRVHTLEYAVVNGEPYGSPVIVMVANEEAAAPVAFALGAAFPNPFTTSTTLTLSLHAPEAVTLEAFDVLGRRALRRDLGVQPAGESRHVLDGAEFPAGVYFVRATTASGVQATRRVVRVE